MSGAPSDASASILALRQAAELAERWVGALPERPVNAGATPDEMAALLDEPLPHTGIAPEAALTEWMERA